MRLNREEKGDINDALCEIELILDLFCKRKRYGVDVRGLIRAEVDGLRATLGVDRCD